MIFTDDVICKVKCLDTTPLLLPTIFTYDSWRVVAEWNSSGALVTTNVYGVGIDEPLYTSNASGQFYYKIDGLGNVRFLLNSSGTMIEQYTYDAFGTPTIKNGSGTVISASVVSNRFMFKAREYLATFGIYDNRKRMYHPGIGKFMQVDPIGFSGDPLNLFRFCNHNPMSRNDPMGEDDFYFTDPYYDDFGFADPFFDPFPLSTPIRARWTLRYRLIRLRYSLLAVAPVQSRAQR